MTHLHPTGCQGGPIILMMLFTRPQGVRWGLDVTGPGHQRKWRDTVDPRPLRA